MTSGERRRISGGRSRISTCSRASRQALRQGGAAPNAMNAANEAAVAAFLDRRIGFLDIAATVAETLERMDATGDLIAGANADGALEIAMITDTSARRVAADVLASL